jgi:hypothetical protein
MKFLYFCIFRLILSLYLFNFATFSPYGKLSTRTINHTRTNIPTRTFIPEPTTEKVKLHSSPNVVNVATNDTTTTTTTKINNLKIVAT